MEHDQTNDPAATDEQDQPQEASAEAQPDTSADAVAESSSEDVATGEDEDVASEPVETTESDDPGEPEPDPDSTGIEVNVVEAVPLNIVESTDEEDAETESPDSSSLDVMVDRVAVKHPQLKLNDEVIRKISTGEPPAETDEPEYFVINPDDETTDVSIEDSTSETDELKLVYTPADDETSYIRTEEPSEETDEQEAPVAKPESASNTTKVETVAGTGLNMNVIDTSALEDIDRLVNLGIGNISEVDSGRLAELIGNVGITPDANDLASDDFWSRPGTMLTETSGLVYVTHPIKGTTTFEFATHYVREGEGPTVSVVAELANGDVVTRNSVGDVVWTYPNGDRDIAFGDGRVWQMFADGTVVVIDDGTDSAPGAAGGESTGASTSGAESGSTAPAEENQSSSSSDDGDDDDDDDSSDDEQSETTEAEAASESEETDDEGGEQEQKGTPNPANEDRSDGPPLAFVTEGRLGGEEVRNAEAAVNVATGGGHTTPSDHDSGQAPIEFLTSEVGRAQFRADQRAIDAQSGQDSTPAEGSEKPSNVPTVEDMRSLEFIAAGGGLINPVEESGGSGVDGGNIGGGTPSADVGQMADNLHLDMLDNSLIGNIDASIASDNLDEDTADRIKSADLDDMS